MFRKSGGLHFYRDAEIVKPRDQTLRELDRVPSVEVVAAEVVVVDLALQDVIGSGEDRSRDSNDGLLGPATGLEAQELGSEVGVVLADGGPRGLDEGGFEPGVSGEGSGGAPFACALVLPRRETGPGAEVPWGGEAAHIDAEFGDQDRGGERSNPADGGQALDGGPKGREGVAQARLQVAHRRLQGIDLGEMKPEQEDVMWRDAPVQGGDELSTGGFEPSAREVGQPLGVPLAGHKSVEDG